MLRCNFIVNFRTSGFPFEQAGSNKKFVETTERRGAAK